MTGDPNKLRLIARREVLANVDTMCSWLEDIGTAQMGDFSHAEASYFHHVAAALSCWAELIAETDGVER